MSGLTGPAAIDLTGYGAAAALITLWVWAALKTPDELIDAIKELPGRCRDAVAAAFRTVRRLLGSRQKGAHEARTDVAEVAR